MIDLVLNVLLFTLASLAKTYFLPATPTSPPCPPGSAIESRVQREVDAELVISFDPAADPAVPSDPGALALRVGVLRLTLAHRLASGRTDNLHIELP